MNLLTTTERAKLLIEALERDKNEPMYKFCKTETEYMMFQHGIDIALNAINIYLGEELRESEVKSA